MTTGIISVVQLQLEWRERETVEFPPTLISFTFERTIQHHQAQESVVEVICTLAVAESHKITWPTL